LELLNTHAKTPLSTTTLGWKEATNRCEEDEDKRCGEWLSMKRSMAISTP